MSIVMSDESHSVKFPINEPAPARNKSQIQEYIEAYAGAGAQHIALQCKDVMYTAGKLQRNRLDFLRVPDTYYDALPSRVGPVDESLDALRPLGILVVRDEPT